MIPMGRHTLRGVLYGFPAPLPTGVCKYRVRRSGGGAGGLECLGQQLVAAAENLRFHTEQSDVNQNGNTRIASIDMAGSQSAPTLCATDAVSEVMHVRFASLEEASWRPKRSWSETVRVMRPTN